MASQKIAAPKELVEQAHKAIEIARDTGKLRRGINETTKAIERGQAKLVVFAEDVNPPEIIAHLSILCDDKKIACISVPTKKDLGIASGIDVPTASIAIIEEGNSKDMIEDIAKKLAELKKK